MSLYGLSSEDVRLKRFHACSGEGSGLFSFGAPEDGIIKNAAHGSVVVGREGLVTGAEIEHAPDAVSLADAVARPGREAFGFAVSDRPADAGGKILAAEREIGLEHQAERRRHVEGRAVHLLARQRKVR